MSGSIKVGGHTVFVHTGASGAGTLSVQGQNGNTLLTDDGTAVSFGSNVRLPASGGIKDSSGNNILTESGGNVSVGNIRLHANSAVRDSNGNAIITDVAGSAVVAPSAGGIPPGAIMSFAMSSAPSGWVVCNGAEYAIADYGDLHTAIGTTWGALTNGSGGAGSSHFRVPDLRGEFLRGFDNGQGNDPDAASRTGGDAIGSSQGHNTAYQATRTNSPYQSSHDDYTLFFTSSGATWGSHPQITIGVNSYSFYRGPTSTGYVTELVVGSGTDTRPRNKYVQYCIKY